MTVRQVFHALLDLPTTYDHHPTMDAIVQVTMDGETFYGIDSIDDIGEGGVIVQVVPFS